MRPDLVMQIPVNCPSRHFLPVYQYPGDAGADLCAANSVDIKRGESCLVGTGVSVAIPEGYVGLVLPRSGMAVQGVMAIPGTIDSGYRGEIKVILYAFGNDDIFHVTYGNRIAQLVILPVVRARFKPVDALPSSARGENGFGSTGR